ncbi:TAXI family TRAP transporter solute-binding subunit [Streptomyces iconiensis]|uniref:TAXI family TRAP transporter solute-binding subunit n=1 Tax=Streptomyces iconiensis TaxID=1384038 RepID=A0ABT6ZPC4_9ACTN|nr:TAXI family TRAP transporter solute-binding subunit [Streptomyces iconiensis]MDJ1130909.1 TAXI family TRAP transporter solute-binding subunit [Streptomyces iconiensis]
MASLRTRRDGPPGEAGARSRPAGLGPRVRHGLWAAGAAAVVCGLLAWWLVPGSEPSPGGKVSFATGVRTGVYERYGKLFKQRLSKDLPDVDLRLRHSQGSVHNIEQVVSGKADFTITAADAVAAYQEQDGRNAGRIRACARLYDDYMQLVVPKNSSVRSARDLKGLTVGVGEKRSGVSLVTGRLLQAAGLDMDRDIEPVRAGIDRMPALLAKGKLDAFFWSGGLPTTAIERLADRTDIKLVQLGDLVPRLHDQEPETRYYRAAVMAPDAYPTVQRGKSVKTLAIANLLVTTDRTDAALTEGVTRSVIKSRDQIGREVHAAQKVDLRTAIYTDPVPLHEGARRYYRSVKP